MKKYWVITLFISSALSVKTQSITGVWLSTNSSVCIEFDSTLHRMNIEDWFENNWKTSKQRFIYRIKDNKLKIIWYYYGKTVSYYKINYLKNGKLSLSNLKEGDGSVVELMGGYEVEFIKTDTCRSCNEYYTMKHKQIKQ